MVPGVTSITASASRAKIPLVSHAERLAVVPAMYGIDDLRDVLARNDTVVLMKVNRRAMAAVSKLEADGELSRCVFVRRATTPRERVEFSLQEISPSETDYFSMLILSKAKIDEENGQDG